MPKADASNKGSAIKGLYAIIDASYARFEEMEAAAYAITRGGCRLVQLRAKDAAASDMLAAARLIRAVAAKEGAVFIVNDRVDVAMASGADGVHLGQDDIPAEEARRLLGQRAIIGVSTHNEAEALKARLDGADYISYGPVFPTRTKKDAQPPRGLEALGELRRKAALPVAAIGGITGADIQAVLGAGADAVACASAIFLPGDIASNVRGLLSKINP